MEKNQIYEFLIRELPEEQIKIDEPMKKHTNFKIGGNADIYVTAKTIEQVQVILKLVKQYQIPLVILGNGSNVLVSDQGIRGIVLSIAIQQFEIEKNREEKNHKLEFLSGQFCEKDFLAPAYINNSDPKYLEIDNIHYSSLLIVNYDREQNDLLLKSIIFYHF